MTEHWQQLVANFAVVALFISAWVHGHTVVSRRPKMWRDAGFGLAMGGGAIASILLAIHIDGALFDLRISLIATAGFFGGPLAAAVAATMALIYRAGLVGGPTVIVASVSILGAAALGVVMWLVTRRRGQQPMDALVLSLGVMILAFGITVLVNLSSEIPVHAVSLPLALMNGAATLFASLFLIRHNNIERERDLLRAAFLQSPDIQFIKTTESRFAAVNGVLARNSGHDNPEDLVGKTDADILESESAAAIVADDRHIVETGDPKIDFEEKIVTPAGDTMWYQTSKVPLRDIDGTIIGIAGWTRDVTVPHNLEEELVQSRNQLNRVLTEMSDGIAMFDSQGTLTYCNEQYRKSFHLTSDLRRSGQHIRDILRAVAETGEQRGIPKGREEEWINAIANTLKESGEQEIILKDGRWMHIKTRPTQDGSALVVVSDISKIKEAEQAMLALTEQLKLLATTDGLTGLANRRAFDEALDREVMRTRRAGEPLSLLLADVDRFKVYNDLYGHQAGDKVLKAVAQCLAGSLLRPSDVAARYGGEEFVAILPGTDEDGAFFVAEAFRDALKDMGIMHKGGERGVVTVSVGITTMYSRDSKLTGADLVRRADEALYDAKATGRDRVVGWQARRTEITRKGA
ncbi:MAG TPA: diguanylate cyclase [Devosia sp.]|nr:diguanylate cyclase [Devosia sp.]